MSDWVTLLCSRKLPEHCKSAIMEKIKIMIKKKKRKPVFQSIIKERRTGVLPALGLTNLNSRLVSKCTYWIICPSDDTDAEKETTLPPPLALSHAELLMYLILYRIFK